MEPSEFVKYFSFEEIFSSLKEYGLFYSKPKKYFSIFFKKDQKDQFRQTIILLFLYSIIVFLFYDERTYKHQLFGILIDVVLTLISCPITYLSIRLTDCFKKRDIGFKEILFFLIHSKFLISPFFLILSVFFINTEAYVFYYLTNILLLLQLYFFLFFFGFFLYKKIGKIVLYCFIIMLLYNLAATCNGLLSFKNKGRGIVYSDVIYDEYNHACNKCDIRFSKFPTDKIVYIYPNNTKLINLLLYSFSDTVSISVGNIDSTNIYISKVKSSIHSIDSVIPNLTYDRAIVGMKKWRDFLSSVLEYYNPKCEKNDIEKIIRIRDTNKNLLYYKLIYKNTDRVGEKYCDAKLYEMELFKSNYNSKRVFILYYPLAILPRIIDNWKTKENH